MNKKQLEPTKHNKNANQQASNTTKVPPWASKTGQSDSEDCELKSLHQQCLRHVLEDVLVDVKIKREETQIDIQMTQLGSRLNESVKRLEKSRNRLANISFATELNRLLDLKAQDCLRFEEITKSTETTDMLNNLARCGQDYLDKLETENVDFGYNKESGHKQLLEAVNDALNGLEQVKKDLGLDTDTLKQVEATQTMLDEMEKEKFDIKEMQMKIENKLPEVCEKILMDISEKVDAMLERFELN